MKILHLSALASRVSVSENYICYCTLYKACSLPSGISAMNVPLERVHSWKRTSSGSDCRRDCRVALSMSCMAMPCMVAPVVSGGSCINCSRSDFSIDLNFGDLMSLSGPVMHTKSVGHYTCRNTGSGKPSPATDNAHAKRGRLSICIAGDRNLPDFVLQGKS